MIGRFERIVPAEDVCGLPKRQAKVTPVERNVTEADERASVLELISQPGVVRLNPGQGDASPYAALSVHQFNLHVDGGGELRLAFFQFPQLGDLAGFGAGTTFRTIHERILPWMMVSR